MIQNNSTSETAFRKRIVLFQAYRKFTISKHRDETWSAATSCVSTRTYASEATALAVLLDVIV